MKITLQTEYELTIEQDLGGDIEEYTFNLTKEQLTQLFLQLKPIVEDSPTVNINVKGTTRVGDEEIRQIEEDLGKAHDEFLARINMNRNSIAEGFEKMAKKMEEEVIGRKSELKTDQSSDNLRSIDGSEVAQPQAKLAGPPNPESLPTTEYKGQTFPVFTKEMLPWLVGAKVRVSNRDGGGTYTLGDYDRDSHWLKVNHYVSFENSVIGDIFANLPDSNMDVEGFEDTITQVIEWGPGK